MVAEIIGLLIITAMVFWGLHDINRMVNKTDEEVPRHPACVWSDAEDTAIWEAVASTRFLSWQVQWSNPLGPGWYTVYSYHGDESSARREADRMNELRLERFWFTRRPAEQIKAIKESLMASAGLNYMN